MPPPRPGLWAPMPFWGRKVSEGHQSRQVPESYVQLQLERQGCGPTSGVAQFPIGTAVARRPEQCAVTGFSGAVGLATWAGALGSLALPPPFHILCVFQSTTSMYRCAELSGVLVC